jgi:hypothetical protein
MGGKLTIFKSESAHEGWGGSLLETTRLLKPHLPRAVFSDTHSRSQKPLTGTVCEIRAPAN